MSAYPFFVALRREIAGAPTHTLRYRSGSRLVLGSYFYVLLRVKVKLSAEQNTEQLFLTLRVVNALTLRGVAAVRSSGFGKAVQYFA